MYIVTVYRIRYTVYRNCISYTAYRNCISYTVYSNCISYTAYRNCISYTENRNLILSNSHYHCQELPTTLTRTPGFQSMHTTLTTTFVHLPSPPPLPLHAVWAGVGGSRGQWAVWVFSYMLTGSDFHTEMILSGPYNGSKLVSIMVRDWSLSLVAGLCWLNWFSWLGSGRSWLELVLLTETCPSWTCP